MENIVFTTDVDKTLAGLLQDVGQERLFVVADKNTVVFCDKLLENVDWTPLNMAVVDCGEEHKSLESVAGIWSLLSRRGARRSSVLLCVGGGTVTDRGGFAAATFKRGMRCINIPTTLLAQVDASVGGKTGFNFRGLKNEIGVFAEPEQVIISPRFLSSLPREQFLSGLAEMLKHGLLSDEEHLERVMAHVNGPVESADFLRLVRDSVSVKERIVRQDPREKGVRKALNFGHTIGHAIESLSLSSDCPLLHGEAVALGIRAELYLSVRKKGFPSSCYGRIRDFVCQYYPVRSFESQVDALLELMMHDKKNEQAGINFTLLEEVGKFSINNYCTPEEIKEALLGN